MNFFFPLSTLFVFTTGLIICLLLAFNGQTTAAAAGDYRSFTTGNWNAVGTWETYNGVSWVAAVSTPTSANGVIEIQAGHTVSVTAIVTADQVLIDATGTLAVTTAALTIANGAGTDLTVNGNLDVSNTISFSGSSSFDVNGVGILRSTGTMTLNAGTIATVSGRFKREGGTMTTTAGFWTVNSGGTFEHAMDAGSLPLATWKAGSTCEVSGTTATQPTNMNQVFKSFTWNGANQTTDINFANALSTVNEDLTIESTGSYSIFLDQQGNNSVTTIGRNFYIQNGITYVCLNGKSDVTLSQGDIIMTGGVFNFNKSGATSYGNQSATVTVNGNVTVSGGTIDMSQSTSVNANKGVGVMLISANLTISGSGGITETSSLSRGEIYFNGASVIQYFVSNTNITNRINYTVNALAILSTSDYILTGTGTFTLSSTGGLMIGHGGGITLTSMTGNVQCTGTRSYNTGADYTYNGIVAQVTGDGFPSQVRKLLLNNAFNCTLTNSVSVSDTLTFTSGLWIATNDTLTLGISTAVRGTLSRTSGHVVGYFRRWLSTGAISNILFPIGTLNYYNGATFSFTTGPTTAGSLVATFVPSSPGITGLPLTDAATSLVNVGYGYWSFGAMNSFAGGTFNLNLNANGFPGINDYTALHIVKKTSIGSSWTLNGTHAAGTGSNAIPVANRTGMTTAAGIYGISSGSVNPLPIELISFEAAPENDFVKLSWITSSELNNDFFTAERSADGKNFMPVAIVRGAGNSTVTSYYTTIDRKPLAGHSYYRLKQTDYDGSFTYSSIVAINNLFSNDNQLILVYASPMPFTDSFSMLFNANADDMYVAELISTSGNVLFSEKMVALKGLNTFSFNDSKNLPAGIYILRITNQANKLSVTRKVVKQ